MYSFIYHVEALEGSTLLGVGNQQQNHCWVKLQTSKKKKKKKSLSQLITRILMHLYNEPVLSIYEVNYSKYRHF